MRPFYAALSLSVGLSLVGCDTPDTFDDPGSEARNYVAVRTRYFAAPSCPTYSCGFNSPFIGHELNVGGEANAQGVSVLGAKHIKYGEVSIGVDGDALFAETEDGPLWGVDLVGLAIQLQGVVDGEPVAMTAKLVEVSEATMWVRPVGQQVQTPSYKFLYEADGIEAHTLCPAPTEGEEADADALARVALQSSAFDSGDLGTLLDLNPQASGEHDFHAVLFSGERIIDEKAEIYSDSDFEWFNIGCAGSSAAKLHLSGHTRGADQRLNSPETPVTMKQAALYSFTGTYCPGAERLTVPGQPLRIADARGNIERTNAASFEPRAAGTVEALWGPDGVVCMTTPRMAKEDPGVWDAIEDQCGEVPACPSRDAIADADEAGTLLTGTTSIISFNLSPESCMASPAPTSCHCELACEADGSCCEDYVDLFWPPVGAAHSPCEPGTVLEPLDGPCVEEIIAVDPYCGSVYWDSICVGEVGSVCGLSCG